MTMETPIADMISSIGFRSREPSLGGVCGSITAFKSTGWCFFLYDLLTDMADIILRTIYINKYNNNNNHNIYVYC